MPAITTKDGHQIFFMASNVIAVTDHDLGTGEASTCVYGIAGGTVQLDMPASTFLESLDNKGAFIELTLLDGNPIWLNGSAVRSARQPEPGEYPVAAKSVASVGGMNIALAIDPDSLIAMLNAQGNRF